MPLEEDLNVPYLKYRPNRKRWVTRYLIPEEYLPYCKTRDGKQKREINRFIKKQCSSKQELIEEHNKNLEAIKAELEQKSKKSVQLLASIAQYRTGSGEERKALRALRRKKRAEDSSKHSLQEKLNACVTSCTVSDPDLRRWIMDWYESYFEEANQRLNDLFHYKIALDNGEHVDDLLSDKLDDLWFEFNFLKYGVNIFDPGRVASYDPLETEELRKILLEQKTNLSPSSPSYKKALRLIRGTMKDFATWQLDSFEKGYILDFISRSYEEVKELKSHEPSYQPYSLNEPTVQQTNKTITTLFDEFAEIKRKKDNPAKSYWDRFKFVKTLASEYLKSTPISQLSRNQLLELRDCISFMPIKRADPRLKDLSLLERSRLSKAENLLRPVHDSANKQLQVLRDVIEYGEGEHLIQYHISVDLRDKFNNKNRKGDIRSEKERRGFSPDELNFIFSNPNFSGCDGTRGKKRRRKGKLILWGKEYWGPLIAIFSGMRPKEIWQMRISQVRQHGNITYFDVNEEYDEQSVKTGEKGFRKVPVHPLLVQLGFLKYLKGRDEHDYMIHDIRKSKAMNRTRYFTRYFLEDILPLLKLDDEDELTDYYSFRHTFASRADEIGLTDRELYTLCGWSSEDTFLSKQIARRYTKSAYNLPRSNKCIQRINYPSINFEPMMFRNLKEVGKYEFEIESA